MADSSVVTWRILSLIAGSAVLTMAGWLFGMIIERQITFRDNQVKNVSKISANKANITSLKGTLDVLVLDKVNHHQYLREQNND